MRRAALFTLAGLSILLVGCETGVEAPAPALKAPDQYVVEGKIVVKEVIAPADGWVVVRVDDGQDAPDLGSILGVARVEAGRNTGVRIPIHWVVQQIEKLWVVLHVDAGQPGAFEYDAHGGPDAPVLHNGAPVQRAFSAFHTDARVESWIRVEDQEIGPERTVVAEEIHVSEPADVVIHIDTGRNTPQVPGIFGITPLETGTHEDVEIKLYDGFQYECGERLWLMLHVRNSGDPDQPFTIDQPIITVPFIVTCSD